ncbi:glycosyltransferase [Mariniflexile sp.]|uniref:glycosyltransferase n=1 Tax=Mariniflexile sp. TaxID=1979402 RepID=UPI004047D6C5
MQKIVFVIESLQCGGAEKSLVTLLNLLDCNKFNIELILFKKGGEFEKFVPSNVHIEYMLLDKNTNTFFNFYRRIKFWFLKKIKFNKLHVAQIHWSVFKNTFSKLERCYDIAIAYNQGFATYYVASKVSSKAKYTWLNTDYKNAGYNLDFDYQFYNCYNKIVCVSKESEKSIKDELKKIGKDLSIEIIKDISDVDFINKMSFENSGLNNDTEITKILTVGRLAKAKGFHLAIEACEILVKKGYRIKWFVIGDGPLRHEIENIIKEKKLQEYFILLGFKENPYPFIKSCCVYAQTSLFEGLGLTVIEATILQKPIVTTNFPTAYTIIENEVTGLICNMTPMAIANGIERYLIDMELKEKVVENLSSLKNNDKEISLSQINELLDI